MTNEDPNAPTQGAPAPPRRSPRQGVGGSPMGSTLSIVLAVVAVVVGFLILNNITSDSSSSDGSSSVETTVASTVETTIAAETTTTVPQLVTQGATVVVANASGVPGSAGRMSAELAGAGFTMAEPTNATVGAGAVGGLLRPEQRRRSSCRNIGRSGDGWPRCRGRAVTAARRG